MLSMQRLITQSKNKLLCKKENHVCASQVEVPYCICKKRTTSSRSHCSRSTASARVTDSTATSRGLPSSCASEDVFAMGGAANTVPEALTVSADVLRRRRRRAPCTGLGRRHFGHSASVGH